MADDQSTTEADAGFAIAPARPPVLPIVGGDAVFPVHRVFCIGRNYAAHAVEMGHDPDREAPFFFEKHPSAIRHGPEFAYPPMSGDVHHEIELVVALKSGGRDIPVHQAARHVFGHAIGLDMTRRDLQAEAKRLGRPWDVAKSFIGAAPCGPITPVGMTGAMENGAISLHVNGEERQTGDLAQMIWKVPEIIAILSTYDTLSPGDLIMTGTPAGVASIKRGDTLTGRIEKLGVMTVTVV